MSRQRKAPAKAPTPAPPAPRALNAGEEKLVADSRGAILSTGISEPYFAQHFRLVKVVDAPAGRAVEWAFSVNGYETTVSDAVGYYTDAGGARVNVHGVRSTLIRAHDITQTIPKARALRILRACIGRHGATSILYKSLELNSPARLYLTARELNEGRDPISEQAGGGVRREEGEEGIKVFDVAFVDLETGRCRVVRSQLIG